VSGFTVGPPAERFDREYGCTEAEWRGWMPRATQGHPCTEVAPGRLEVRLDDGALDLAWTVLPPRVIALIRLPRLAVSFGFRNVGPEVRRAFMRVFDLHLQRGGG
jgi:hypothetical protein